MEAAQTPTNTFAPSSGMADKRMLDVAATKTVPAHFATFLTHNRESSLGFGLRRSWAVGVAVAAHLSGFAYVVYGDLMRVDELAAPAVALSLLAMPGLEKIEMPAPPAPPTHAPMRARNAVAARARSTELTPTTTVPPVAPPVAPEPAKPSTPTSDVEGAVSNEAATGAATASTNSMTGANSTIGAAIGSAPGTAPVMASEKVVPQLVLDEQTRRNWLAKYLREQLRKRIDDNRFYPPEAEEEGLEAVVVLRITIDKTGRLLSVSVVRGEHIPVLARAALATLRKAQPFPPPPKELGDLISLDVSIDYRIAL